jgi:xanthine dehydrogenase accessory factor
LIVFFEKMNELLCANIPFVSVTVVDAQGSVPQEIGAKMLITESGLHYGTVGGGKVETRAIKEAQNLLSGAVEGTLPRSKKGRVARTHFANWSLDRDIGMTCGGSVRIYFETYNTHSWNITIFGAGHCAGALISLLTNLECRITCIDPRPEWLAKLPDSPKLTKKLVEHMPGEVESIVPSSFVILMTMGHTTDKPILLEILRRWQKQPFPYLGVIGSRAKAARLYKDIKEAGLPEEYCSLFYCPMGLPFGNNQPQEIAISIAAQLLQVRDQAGGETSEIEELALPLTAGE